MNRRGFLKSLAGTAAGALLADGLLELVGERKIFLPPRGGWPSNHLEVAKQYTISEDPLPARIDVLYGYGALFNVGDVVEFAPNSAKPRAVKQFIVTEAGSKSLSVRRLAPGWSLRA